ncbi:hypothetical protein N7488_010810 [Penicillium malachiteum]|nr:hypothetical protein N7488_010810 [Penicillium malachiteum]
MLFYPGLEILVELSCLVPDFFLAEQFSKTLESRELDSHFLIFPACYICRLSGLFKEVGLFTKSLLSGDLSLTEISRQSLVLQQSFFKTLERILQVRYFRDCGSVRLLVCKYQRLNKAMKQKET